MSQASTILTERLYELEIELMQMAVRHSPERLSSLLADSFREFGSSGRILNKREIIDALSIEPEVELSISDFRAEIIGDRVALVTYRAVKKEPAGQLASLRSSLWVLNNGRWQMLFHQGTKAPDEPPQKG
jgi:hypothetical protein